jgi:ribose 5-phosphate isomerase
LSNTPGIVEHGLFIGLASLALVGRGDRIEEIRK